MKGRTHAIIGLTIGAAASVYYPMSVQSTALYLIVGGFSALSADLDGTNMLSSKLDKLTKAIRASVLWAGILGTIISAVLFWMRPEPQLVLWAASGAAVLLGLITRHGTLRNLLVCLIGVGLFYAGVVNDHMLWLIGLGVYIAIVPWLAHRGLSHSIWAVLYWCWLGRELQNDLNYEGVALVAAAGYLSHLVADTLTPSGVKWLFPLWKKSIKLRF
ncbi:inner membrane protein [Paenibacillus phyllosphaerae]|uniref:Inner membrane protein n=1 Tax=Paenibacillus phyllosphaerae TaxID=274593 RepID=A0A7W5B6T6_9BACL|nr:metal-dependent hydrolase [Paenibacillus phyllosphaerae]MBB3114786.1 inner membrane protein [Paenibacillus phyllosphaerae]